MTNIWKCSNAFNFIQKNQLVFDNCSKNLNKFELRMQLNIYTNNIYRQDKGFRQVKKLFARQPNCVLSDSVIQPLKLK